jgi:hypothetical protein
VSSGRAAANLVDIAAMAAVAAAIWFGWSPLLAYLPDGLASDIDAVAGWLGADTTARGWLGWLGAVEWVVAALLVVVLFWAAEKLVGAIGRRLPRGD